MDDLKNPECCRCHKYANKFSEVKPKDSKRTFKVRKVEEPVLDKVTEEAKSIRIRFSDLTAEGNDPFIRYWIRVYGNRKSEDGSESEEKKKR